MAQKEINFSRAEQLGLVRDAWLPTTKVDGASMKPATLKLVLRTLDDFCRGSEGWPRQKKIAASANISERTVKRAIKALYELGLITIETKWNSDVHRVCNHYRLVWSELAILREPPVCRNRSATGSDRSAAGADRSASVADQSATAADRSASVSDRSAIVSPDQRGIGTDRSATGADRSAIGADRSAIVSPDQRGIGTDRSATGADQSATGADRSATGGTSIRSASKRKETYPGPGPGEGGLDQEIDFWCEKSDTLNRAKAIVISPVPANLVDSKLKCSVFHLLTENHLSNVAAMVYWWRCQLAAYDPVSRGTKAELLLVVGAAKRASMMPRSEVRESRLAVFKGIVTKRAWHRVIRYVDEVADEVDEGLERSDAYIEQKSVPIGGNS